MDATNLALGIDATGATRGAREFVSALQHIEAAGAKASRGVIQFEKSTKDLDRSLTSTKTGLLGFASGLGATAGLMAGMAVRQFASDLFTVADAYARLDARIALYVGGAENATRAHEALLAAAQRTGVAFEATGGFFAKLASQSKALGLNYEQLVTITESVQNALVVSGASATEASAAMQQLAQAFTRGKLGGDEFITMGESAPRILDAMASAMGITRGELAQMAEEGRLTGKVMSDVFLTVFPQLQSEAQALGNTVSQESTRMQNAWKELLVELNKTGGASELAIEGMSAVTKFLSDPATLASVNDFAKDIRALIEDIRSLYAYGAKFAEFLNGVQEKSDEVAKSINRTLGIGRAPFGESALFKGSRTGASGSWEPGITSLGEVNKLDKPMFAGPTMLVQPGEAVAKKGRSGGGSRSGGGGGGSGRSAAREAEADVTAAERLQEQITKAWMTGTDQRIALAEMERDETIAAINATKMSATQKEDLRVKAAATAAEKITEIRAADVKEEEQKQATLLDALGRYEEANLQVHGRASELIIRQREEEVRAIDQIEGASPEQKAQARVLAEDTASQKIIEIRRREADQIASLEEENLQARIGTSWGDNRKDLQLQLLRKQKESALEEIRMSNMSEEGKAQATMLKSSTFDTKIADIDPEPWEAAKKALAAYGEQISGVDAATQMSITAIDGFAGAAASAFSDAVTGAKSFEESLDALASSLSEMILKMIIAQAISQALGAGMNAMMGGGGGSAGMGLTAGTTGSGYQGGGFQTTPFMMMAKGGVVKESGLANRIYARPTYFPLSEPSGLTTMAKGRGLMGESGPEAVMPLSRSPQGVLGVSSSGGGEAVVNNITINNNSKATVSSEESPNQSGGKDLAITIADQVERVVASRMSRSGTMVNRAVSGVGGVRAR